MERGIGEAFQQETKYHRERLQGGYLDWARKPPPYKRYPECPLIPLPPGRTRGGTPLWEVLAARRSERSFQARPLELPELSQLLWACQGVTAEQFGMKFRTAPSAGALYPVETYLVLNNVDGVAAGVYHYALEEHALEQIRQGDYRVTVARAALDQKIAYEANLVFVWTAVFERCKWKYRQRAFRYVYLDAGHLAQNAALAAVALGLGSCQIAAIYDEEANELLGVDGIEESTLYMTVVGRPAG